MQIFSRHVSPVLAESIWRQREQFMDGRRPRSRKIVVTVLFSDLQGFTPVAEKMDPLMLTRWLNTYMESMAQLIMDHGGVVDDYAGDGIKANFGVPVPRSSEEELRRDATNAVRCSLAMADRMEELNRQWREHDLPTARMRIGISTGTVVATTIGSPQRLKYTTVGNHVNIAARLESYDKLAGDPWMSGRPCRVLMSESTARCIDDDFQLREMGEVRLKGQEQGIRVFFLEGPGCESQGKNKEERQ
jgi:adenylate cyclase